MKIILKMDKFTNLNEEVVRDPVVNTNKKEANEYANNRLKTLVNRVLPLLKEAEKLYPNVKKYKRCTTLTNKLNELLDKLSPQIKDDIKRGDRFTYTPDNLTLKNFAYYYTGQDVTVVDIFNNKYNRESKFCDSLNVLDCNYLVEIKIPYESNRIFWTRRETLKPLKKRNY